MSGLSRFDFYPRDWFLDTRDLSCEAKGVYIDLLAAIYARGEPLPYDEHELCRLIGMKSVRPLKRIIGELISKKKFFINNGYLVNGRAMEELDAASQHIEQSRRGGKASSNVVSGKFGKSLGQTSAKLGANFGETSAKLQPDLLENQGDNPNLPSPSPSPSPSPKEKKGGRNNVPPEDILQAFELWNELAGNLGLPIAVQIDDRTPKFRARLAENGGIDGWQIALNKVRGSPYLRGEVNGFRTNIDFMLQKSSFRKVIEGNYDDAKRSKGSKW